MKNKQKSYRKKQERKQISVMVGIFFVLMILVVGVSRILKRPEKSPDSTLEIESHVRSLVNNHLSSMKESSWFLENAQISVTPELMKLCVERRQRLIDGANAWCPTNNLGIIIKEWLPRWSWGIGNQTNAEGQTSRALTVISGDEMVMLVPHDMFARDDGINFFCSNDKNEKVISIRAFEIPDQIFTAFTLHEIGHAYRHWQEKRIFDTSEEVEMHTLSADVLNNYSHGKYKGAIRKIIDRQGPSSKANFKNVFAGLTQADLTELDQVIGAAEVGRQVTRSTVMQHLFTIGFEAIDRYNGGIPEKKALYAWVRSLPPP